MKIGRSSISTFVNSLRTVGPTFYREAYSLAAFLSPRSMFDFALFHNYQQCWFFNCKVGDALSQTPDESGPRAGAAKLTAFRAKVFYPRGYKKAIWPWLCHQCEEESKCH